MGRQSWERSTTSRQACRAHRQPPKLPSGDPLETSFRTRSAIGRPGRCQSLAGPWHVACQERSNRHPPEHLAGSRHGRARMRRGPVGPEAVVLRRRPHRIAWRMPGLPTRRPRPMGRGGDEWRGASWRRQPAWPAPPPAPGCPRTSTLVRSVAWPAQHPRRTGQTTTRYTEGQGCHLTKPPTGRCDFRQGNQDSRR